MYFDFPAFIRYNFKAFFLTKGKHYRLTPKRFLVLFIWLILYIPNEIIYHLLLLLDEVLFPGYRKQEVKDPVFIIGNPRSGTTLLHRLMNLDGQTFTSFQVWELIFAPSITQRKLIWGIIKLAKLVGAPVNKALHTLNKRTTKRTKKIHAVRIDAAEEDDHVLIHGWCSATLWPLYPIPEEMLPYFFFDRDIPLKKREKVMKLYKNMLQRHIYAHGGKLRLLSKNPDQSAKIDSLQQAFPDARFINLARNPLETVPSMMDYMAAGWQVFCDPLEAHPHKDEFFNVMGFYYKYPMEYFKDKPDACYFIRYDHLIDDPERVVSEVYDFLDLDMSENFASVLKQEAEKSRQFQSEHSYTLEEMQLNPEQITESFSGVFEFYEFSAEQNMVSEKGVLLNVREWQLARKQRRRLRAKKRRKLLRRKEIRLD